jgi:hypothetical protein
VLAGLKASLASQVRITFADKIQRSRQQDRRKATQHHGRQNLGEHVALRLAENFRVSDGERDSPFSDAACHDGYHNKEERVISAKPEQGANKRADEARDNRADGERHKNLQEPLHQDLTVHAQNAADDDAGDEQVEEVGVLREFDDGLLKLRRQQLVVGKGGRDKGREDRRSPNITKHGRALADFRASEAADHQDGNHYRHFALDVARVGETREQSDKNDIDRKRDDPDPGVHDFPPSLRPPRFAQRLRRCRDGDALLHGFLQICS